MTKSQESEGLKYEDQSSDDSTSSTVIQPSCVDDRSQQSPETKAGNSYSSTKQNQPCDMAMVAKSTEDFVPRQYQVSEL